MDIVFLRDLRVDTVIGIYDWERRIRQTVSVDLEVATDVRRAAASDAIEDAVDYKALAKRLSEFIAQSEFQLVETLAERAAAMILAEFQVPWLRLSLTKPGALPDCRGVGVVIERGVRRPPQGEAGVS